MRSTYRIEQIEEGYRVHFMEHTNFPFSITDEKATRAIDRANEISRQLKRQERERMKAIRYTPTRAVLTAPTD